MAQEIIQEILTELKKQRQPSDALWDASDIADYLKLSKSTVQSRILARPNFPRAIRIPSSDIGLGGRRWLAKEVKQWIIRHREPMH